MLLKSKNHILVIALIFSTAVVFFTSKALNIHPGVRITWINFFIGILAAVFGFIIFAATNLLILLIRGKAFETELNSHKENFSKLDTADIITNGIFSGAFYELLLRVGIFGFTLAKSSALIAYPIGFLGSYAVFFTKKSRFLPIAFAVFGLYSCFLYQTHRSYFLIAVCHSCLWISWLIYLKSSYFKRNYGSILDIRRKLTLKFK